MERITNIPKSRIYDALEVEARRTSENGMGWDGMGWDGMGWRQHAPVAQVKCE